MKKLSAMCLLALAPAMAWANIIPTFTTVTGSGPYTWNYRFDLSADQDVRAGMPPTTILVPHVSLDFGSFVTVYDFAGYLDNSCTGPAGWTCTAQSVGFTPDDVLPQDRTDIMNITWVYTAGPTITGQPIGRELGRFSAQSLYNEQTFVDYTARGVKNNGPALGTIADNIGTTVAPANPVPEPGSFGLAGLGLFLLATRLRKPRSAAA